MSNQAYKIDRVRPEPKLRAIRLKAPWQDFEAGTVLGAVENPLPEGTRWEVARGDGSGENWFDEDEASKLFEILPEDQATTLMETEQRRIIQQGQNAQTWSQKSPGNAQLLLGHGAQEEEPESSNVAESKELALGPKNAPNSIGKVRGVALRWRREAETLRSTLAQNKKILSQHGEAQKMLLKRKQQELERISKDLQEKLADMEDCLHMINLYLGTGETVVPLRDGEPAPADEPICIRQSVLAMEEEAALLDPEGIDYSKIGDFDRYLLEKGLLEAVLPEPKGVVVLKPCRQTRRYEDVDPLTQVMLNQENAKTYWIVKNGQKLWRFWSDLELGERCFPSARDGEENLGKETPGSEAYYEKIKAAEGVNRLYLKAGLRLQGIIDRTKVFAPFQNPKIKPKITDPSTWPGQLRFIQDGSEGALGEGRPGFEEWLEACNGSLLPGQRVLVGQSPSPRERGDIHPKWARWPHGQILRVKKSPKGELRGAFRVEHEEKNGSVRLDQQAKNWLNIDRTNPEDIAFYLRDRGSRREAWANIGYLLPSARKLLEEEKSTEAPARQLLENHFAKELDIEETEAKALTEEILGWWKRGRKDFRPVDLENAQKAWAAMTTEGAKRHRSRGLEPLPSEAKEGAVLIVRKNPTSATAYHPSDPQGRPPMCRLHLWKWKRGRWEETKGIKEIRVPLRREHLHVEAQDKEWLRLADRAPSKFLVPETTAAIEAGLLEEIFSQSYWGKAQRLEKPRKPLAAVLVRPTAERGQGQKWTLFVAGPGWHRGNDIFGHEINFEPKGKMSFGSNDGTDVNLKAFLEGKKPAKWGEDEDDKPHENLPLPKVLEVLTTEFREFTFTHVWPENIEDHRRESQAEKMKSSQQQKEERWIDDEVEAFEKAQQEDWHQEKWQEYLKDDPEADPGFFEDHLRTLPKPVKPTKELRALESWLRKKLKAAQNGTDAPALLDGVKKPQNYNWPEVPEEFTKKP
jgi:hypothetical protein